MKPITLTLLSLPNETTLILSLASIFSLSFLTRSLKITHIKASVLIKMNKGISIILIYVFNNYVNLCCFDINAYTDFSSFLNVLTTYTLYFGF